jgi:protein transport protein SEC61 subunit gamma and related proteins
MAFNFRSFTAQCIRVWHLMKKPSNLEFKTVAKISAIGLGVIGLIGFIINIIMTLLS